MNVDGVQRHPATDFAPMGYGEVLDRALVLYRRNWRVVLSLSFPVLFPSALIVGFGNIGYQWAVRTQLGIGEQDPAKAVLAGVAIAAFFGATGLHGLLSVVVQGLLSKTASDLYLGREVAVRDAYRFTLHRAVALLVTTILMSLGITLGVIALLAPGIIISVYWSFVIQIVMLEEKSFVDALSRSWRLVRGHWWHTLFFAGLLGMLIWLLQVVLLAPSHVLTIVELIRHPEAIFLGETPNVMSLAAQGIFGAVATAGTAPVGAFALTLFYYDLRARKEGFDLLLRAEELRAAAPTAER